MELADNIINAIALGGLYALLALGIALVFGIMRLINFAHGELIMVSAYVLVVVTGASLAVVVLIMIAVAVFFALAMERLAFRPIRGAHPATLLVTSFAVSYFLQNLAVMVFGSQPRTVNVAPFLEKSFTLAGLQIRYLEPVTLAATVILLASLGLFLTRTMLGIQMRAAAENFDAARLLGVRANRVIAAAFAISGTFAAVASLLIVAQDGTVTPTMGAQPVLIAFVATVLGGLGSLGGAALGGFVLGVVTVALEAYLPAGLGPYRDAFLYSSVIFVLFLRPHGLVAIQASERQV